MANDVTLNLSRVAVVAALVLGIASPIATAAVFYSRMVEAERVAQLVRDNPSRIKAAEERIDRIEDALDQWQAIKVSTAETAVRTKYIEQMLDRHMQERKP